ncbi:hypothetical protein JCM13664_02780 [Methylothermus subterraneus]
MFHRLKDRLNRFRFARACQGIYATPPLSLGAEQAVAVLTQLQHKDVILFLLAIKSFARYVPLREVWVLNDGSLTDEDQAVLTHHLSAQILPIARFQNPRCPRGGCWERLLAIAQISRDRYLIQLDADTLARGPLPEVIEAIATQTAFVLGTWDGQELEPMRACAERVRARHPNAASLHVQLAAEAAFLDLPEVDRFRYARGCAAFCGFPPGAVEVELIERFSQAMEARLGDKWRAWGSEQVMSNVVIANAPKARVLPHPDYSDCHKMNANTRFIHFVGTCRFQGQRYAQEAKQVLRELL